MPTGCPKAASASCCALVRAGEGGADGQRLLDAVARRLERGDPQRTLGVHLVGLADVRRLLGDVEELADRHLPAHDRVLGARGRRTRVGCRGQSLFEQIIAPGHQQIAQQHRARPSERRRVARPSRASDARPRARGARRGVRGGCRSCRSRRRARARRRGRSPARRPLRSRRPAARARSASPPPLPSTRRGRTGRAAAFHRPARSRRPRRGAALRDRDRPSRLSGPRGICSDAGKQLRRHPGRVTRA